MGYFIRGVIDVIALAQALLEIKDPQPIGFNCHYTRGYVEFEPLHLEETRLLGVYTHKENAVSAEYFKLMGHSRMVINTHEIPTNEFYEALKNSVLVKYLKEKELFSQLKQGELVRFTEKVEENLIERTSSGVEVIKPTKRKVTVKLGVSLGTNLVLVDAYEREHDSIFSPILPQYERILCKVTFDDTVWPMQRQLEHLKAHRARISELLGKVTKLEYELAVSKFKERLIGTSNQNELQMGKELQEARKQLWSLLEFSTELRSLI